MSDSVDALLLDLLEWIGAEPRTYTDVMNAWRTSCPRLPVWEDANDRGLVVRRRWPSCKITKPLPQKVGLDLLSSLRVAHSAVWSACRTRALFRLE